MVPVAVGATGFEFGGTAPRLLVPLLKPGEFARGVEFAAGCRLSALGRGQDGLSDVESFPGAAAGDGGPFQYTVRQSRFAGLGVRQGQLAGRRPAAWAIRWAIARICSSPALTWVSAVRRSSVRRSSTAAKRRVSKSLPSSLPRASASARRNRAKSPCGRRTTWQNWSRLIPMSWVISSPIS